MVIFMPMFGGLKFPANSMTILKYQSEFARFDMVPTDWIDDLIYYFPEGDAYNLNFESVGIESELMLSNIGIVMYIIYLNFLMAILLMCFYLPRNKHRYLNKAYSKISKFMNWFTVNRLYQ